MYNKRLVFAGACMGMLLFGMVFLSLGTISVFIQEKFGLDGLRVASLASSLPFGILIGSMVFGPVVDRFGYKFLMALPAAMIFLTFQMLALANSIALFQLSFFLTGLSGGIINGVTNALIADITEREKSSGLSLLGVFYGIGALGMPLVISFVTKYFSYESVISGIGFFVLLPFFFFVFLNFPEPKHKQGFPVGKALNLFREPVLILLGVILFFESALEGISGNWTTTYLKFRDIDNNFALRALSLQVAAIALTRLILTFILKHYRPQVIMYISLMLILTGAVLLAFAVSGMLVILSMILLGSGFAAVFPIVLGKVGEMYASITGTAFSLVIVMALTGNTLINYTVGVVSDRYGIQWFPLIIAVCTIFMIVIYRLVNLKLNTLK